MVDRSFFNLKFNRKELTIFLFVLLILGIGGGLTLYFVVVKKKFQEVSKFSQVSDSSSTPIDNNSYSCDSMISGEGGDDGVSTTKLFPSGKLPASYLGLSIPERDELLRRFVE